MSTFIDNNNYNIDNIDNDMKEPGILFNIVKNILIYY